MVSERTGWDRSLVVGAGGKGLVGHAGVVLLRRLADRSGLTEALAGVFPAGGPGWRDRAVVFVQLAISIVLGARSVTEAEQLALHHERVMGPGVSDSTVHRTLNLSDGDRLAAIARVRARVRRVVWSWLSLRPGGFPWLTVAGKRLHNWVIVDMDASTRSPSGRRGPRTPC